MRRTTGLLLAAALLLPGAARAQPGFGGPDGLAGEGLPWNPLPPGFADPGASNVGFQDPAQGNPIPDQAILEAMKPLQMPPSVAFPPDLVAAQMPKPELEVKQETDWIEYLPTIVLPILMGIGALGRRRGGKDAAR